MIGLQQLGRCGGRRLTVSSVQHVGTSYPTAAADDRDLVLAQRSRPGDAPVAGDAASPGGQARESQISDSDRQPSGAPSR